MRTKGQSYTVINRFFAELNWNRIIMVEPRVISVVNPILRSEAITTNHRDNTLNYGEKKQQ